MGYQNFISELEASALAGVSIATLNRFYEAGYLQFETDSDGLRLVSKSEVEELFGVNGAPVNTTAETKSPSLSEQIETVVEPSPIPLEETSARTETAPERAQAPSAGWDLLDREIQKLKNIVNVQEELLKIKDTQISEAASEKEWLRKRIENLEQRLDRDQVILMNESNIIRELLATQQRKRTSPLRAALEWFGLVEPASTASPAVSRIHTYEVNR